MTSTFSPSETAACCRLIELGLKEDFGPTPGWGPTGDITSWALIPPGHEGSAVFVARAPGVLSGLPAAALVLGTVDHRLVFQPLSEDGAVVQRGTRLATVKGPIQGILMAERTALNFLQRLSGIATQTRRFVNAVAGSKCQILDTRKTTPGWRLLEKYAVRCGGGRNHRLGLYDMVLIKDNHLAAASSRRLTIAQAVNLVRKEHPHGPDPTILVGIEVDTLEQLKEALAARPDMVLLDNLAPDQLRQAVAVRDATAPAILLEASGGVTLETVRAIAETGVDRISVGALTHSAPALDIALDYEP